MVISSAPTLRTSCAEAGPAARAKVAMALMNVATATPTRRRDIRVPFQEENGAAARFGALRSRRVMAWSGGERGRWRPRPQLAAETLGGRPRADRRHGRRKSHRPPTGRDEPRNDL